jgi:hypothetical protein
VPQQTSFRLNQDLTIALVCAFILGAASISSATTDAIRVFGIQIPALCPFKLVTTWDCPGCGLTRSLVLALHGNLVASYSMHIWGIPLMLILLFQIPFRLYRLAKPEATLLKLPPFAKKWISSAIFLSIILPWAFKTVALAVIRYL